ncbi:MAG: hypothetical protein IJH11_01970 [Lachnospiraceae bacterium]|nr:hypothetical protein [Lachnospiraceae bacterium]
MNFTECVDNVVAWLDDVCKEIELKVPDDYLNDDDYNVATTHPAAFPLYVPGKDRLPPNVAAPIPSVCAQLMEGSDDLKEGKRILKIRLCLSCWNPGTHSDGTYMPRKNEEALGGYSYYRLSEGSSQTYKRNMNGWKDAFNFADLILRKLEKEEYINGLRLVKESDIKFGLFTEDGNIWDYYPYWHNWITFDLETGITPMVPTAYEDLI